MRTTTAFIIMNVYFFSLTAIDNVHFYRANFFWGEPRLECPWLTTVDVTIGTGKTKTGNNNKGKKVDILNIYGLQNMHKLAENVPGLNPADPIDTILIDLNAVPERKNFGQFKLQGKFSIIESTIDVYQNIEKGFFFELHIPARKFDIKPQITTQDDLKRIDQTPKGTIQPNKKTPEWQAFLTNFFSILKRHNITVRRITRSGLGDISLLAGWACSYQNTIYLDFIDLETKTGVLFPTGKKRNPDKVFDIPNGYDGHWGIPLKFNVSIGIWEWFTCGLHIGSLFLAGRTKNLRIHTSNKQNGFIKLAKAKATVDPGIYFDFDMFAKADHFCKGLSILLAYSFNSKEKDVIKPKNKALFDKKIVNNDPLFASWHQHVFHIMVEYDFAKKLSDIGTRIGFFYNHVIDGKRIFRTNMKVSYIGIDAAWCF